MDGVIGQLTQKYTICLQKMIFLEEE